MPLLISDSFVLITHFNQYIFYSVKITRTYDYDRLECQKFDQVHAIIRPRTHFKDFNYVIHWVKVLCGLRFTRKASVDNFFSAFSVAHRWNWRYRDTKSFFGQVNPILAKTNEMGTKFVSHVFCYFFLFLSRIEYDCGVEYSRCKGRVP